MRGAERAQLAADIRDASSGDERALERLYAATSAKLYGVCLRILKDEAEAEDVLQEVYLQIWRRGGGFDSARGASALAWMAAIARNRSIDRLRVSKTHLARPLELAYALPDDQPTPSVEVERAEDSRRLNVCLETLEPVHAAAVRRAFFEGATYESLAQAAHVPLGTMKSWIRRALQRLRVCLDA